MKLSPYVLQQIIEVCKDLLTGSQWVSLMCKYGFNDIYDSEGLPDIGKANSQRPSKKEYLFNRLSNINDSNKLTVLLTDLFNSYKNVIDFDRIKSLINRDSYTLEDINGAITILGELKVDDNHEEIEAKFNNIQAQILTELNKAKVIIWVAMAWFTNKHLANKLIEKFNQGLDVRVILFDDHINRKHGVELAGIPVVKIKGKHGGKMHHKYCIIDNQRVITGSYNWSDSAEFKNYENIQITPNNDVSTKYSMDFLSLFNKRI